ncbi:MAG: hypothetical protein PF518_13535 [Spirochaetaceae bacterium]|jgi:hypothetical protein|nr:hypothetical protein [Spirochaetaceae bacterium]
MSNSNEKKPQMATHLQHVPEFVNVDSIRREEFLSQIGNFASEHRKIFQSLCENWEPGINYIRFVSQNSGMGFAEKDLVNLLSRLKIAKCGLLKHKCIDGDLKKNTIILTDMGNNSFYYHLIEDEIEIATLSSVHPMVTSATMIDQGIPVPNSFIEVLTPRNISRSFFKECINDGRIFKIPTSDDDYFLATSGTLSSLITMSLRRIREGLRNSNILSYVAKLQSSAIMDLKKEMSTNNPNFWRKLTVSILDAKEEILQKIRTINKDFFSACELIRFYSENELKSLEKKRADDLRMFEEMKTISHEISQEESFFIDQSALLKKLEKPMEQWPDFKDKFYENFVTAKKKTQLPQIVYIGLKYIHRDNIYTYFVTNLAQFSADLQIEFQKLMESLLRNNNKSNISVFFSNENFRYTIREKIRNWDPMMISFLDRPAIISEAIIHVAKKKMKVRDIARIRTMLEYYFEPGKLKFKPLEVLFNLDILEIFQYAFLKIPIWKQLFVRILGRYDSYRKTFTGMSRTFKAKTSKTNENLISSIKKNEPDFSNMTMEERKREYRKRQNYSSPSRRKSSSRSGEKPVMKKRYTTQEQNAAWNEFNTSFTKKKNSKKNKKLTDL